MKLILDVETTGFPEKMGRKYFPCEQIEKYNSSRIVQITFMLCDDALQCISLYDYIIQSDGFDIPNEEFHGITLNKSLSEGIPFSIMALQLHKILLCVDEIIAHNADFDINIIKSELYRYKLNDILDELVKKNIYCSMKNTAKLVNIKNKYGIKYPTLKELYEFVLCEEMTNAHDSKYDVLNLQKALINI